MPGLRLSGIEQGLISDWANKAHRYPRLASLEIAGPGALRGIRAITLGLDRPITALCGPSGAGKSTLLELCALAFRPKGSPPPDAIGPALAAQFIAAPGETPLGEVQVTWRYSDNEPPPVTLDGTSRTLSVSRPERPIVRVTAARLAQARHQPALALAALSGMAGDQLTTLSRPYVDRLSDVLRKSYVAARRQRYADTSLALCETPVPYTYSGFNMGLAEESVIDIFCRLYDAPSGSLVVIEDIDTGLPAEIAARLARSLVEICRDKSFQIVLSASSPEFLDALPRQFRTLIEFDGSTHHVETEAPMHRVLRGLGATVPPDVVLFCEDDIAEAIILQTVDGTLRRRLRIVRAGAKQLLPHFAYFHQRSGWGHKVAIVWDGDVEEDEATGWLRSLKIADEEQQTLARTRLPGPLAPERWLIAQLLDHEEGANRLGEALNESVREMTLLLNTVRPIKQHHSTFFELARQTGLDKTHILTSAVRAVKQLAHRPLDDLGDQLARIATGEIVIEVGRFGKGGR